jgi:elongation factor Ts
MTTAHIDAKTVMALRQKTGLGFGDCRTALTETGGDMAKAEALLREKLKDKMDSRSDRAAGQGAVAVAIEGGKAAIVEVRAETDFTARNDEFVAMAKDVATMALALPAGEAVASDAITKRVDDIRIKTGENISFGRGVTYHGGHFGSYVHHDGKLGVLMQYEGELDAETAKGICQHIAGALELPQAVDESGLPATLVTEKKAQARAEAEATGKPAPIVEKMAEGKVRKMIDELTLVGQPYCWDEKKRIGELLPKGTKILAFARVRVGGGS